MNLLNRNIKALVAAAVRALTGWQIVHWLPGVQGNGTNADPYTGWGPTVAASPSGTRNYFRSGLFDEDAEVEFVNPGVSAKGAGARATTIRVRDARPGKAVLRWSLPTSADNFNVSIGGFCVDGGQVTSRGIELRDVNFSDVRNVRFRDVKDWLVRTSRGVNLTWDDVRFHYRDNSPGFVTANGIYLADVDPITGDEATTVSSFRGVEVAGVSGTALEIAGNSFSLVFSGCAFEISGVNLKLGDNTFNLIFDGTNFESRTVVASDPQFPSATTASEVHVSGHNHEFNRGNWVGAIVKIIGGTGGHVFDRIFLPGAIDDAGTGINTWWSASLTPPMVQRVTGVNRRNNVQRWGVDTYRQGDHVQVISSNPSDDAAVAAGVVGLVLLNTGSRVGGMVQVAGGALYGFNGGGIDYLDPAALENGYAWKAIGRDLYIGGTFGAAELVAAKAGGVNAPTYLRGTSNAPAGGGGPGPVVLELAISGDRVAHVAIVPGGSAFFAADGGIAATDFTTAHLKTKAAFSIDTQQRTDFYDRLFVQNINPASPTRPLGTPVGGGYLYAEGGALKYKGSAGTVTTVGAA